MEIGGCNQFHNHAELISRYFAGVLDAKLGKDYPIGEETDQTSTKCGKDDPPKHNWRGCHSTNDQDVQLHTNDRRGRMKSD